MLDASEEKADRVKIRRAGMDLLARREHSSLELERKLHRRFKGSPLIADVLEELREDCLLCDVRFAEAYLYSKSRRGIGPRRIRSELKSKGVATSIINTVFTESDIDWQTIRYDVLQKKFGDLDTADALTRARRARFLLQRGFSAEQE